MKLDIFSLNRLKEASDVVPGNVYPAMGGKKPGTDYWLVIATSDTAAHMIGFNDKGDPVSTTSYLKHAVRQRPIIGFIDLSDLMLRIKDNGPR